MTSITVQEANELVRGDTNDLIKALLEVEQADCPVLHHFGPGVYIREVRFPAGSLVVGHIQKFAQMNVFIQGSVKMVAPNGETKVLTAPMTFMGEPGRKVGFILEDVIWQNIFPNPDDCRDVEALEDKWLEKTPYFEAHKHLKLLSAPTGEYEDMLADLGVTAEQVATESAIESDLIPFPGTWGSQLAVRASGIHGKGLFAETNLETGQVICPARINGQRTPAGRYTNHSDTPNIKAVPFGNDIAWVALRDIHGRRGGLNGEEITVDYRQVYAVARGESE